MKRLTLPVSIVLPIVLSNRNDGQGHGHWRTVADRTSIEATLRALRHVYDPSDLPPVAITITRLWGKGQRSFDEDSIGRGNAKQLIDAMVACGWFVNDCRPHVMQCDYRQRRADDGVAAVLVEISRWMPTPEQATESQMDKLVNLYAQLVGDNDRLERELRLRTIRRLEPLPYQLDDSQE